MKFNIPNNDNPVLFDKTIGELSTILKSKLAWLNNAFGRAYVIKKENVIEPHLYIGSAQYISLMPSDDFNNYCFTLLDDPQQYDGVLNSNGTIKSKMQLIFWFDMSTIFVDDTIKRTEDVKLEILNALTKSMHFNSGRLEINAIHEDIKNVFKGFTLDNTKNMYFMYPYYGFRFECTIKTRYTC